MSYSYDYRATVAVAIDENDMEPIGKQASTTVTASASVLHKILAGAAKNLQEELARKVQAYMAVPNQARVDVSDRYLDVSITLDMSESDVPSYGRPTFSLHSKREAEELAQILLGNDYALGSHKLKSDTWVALKKIKL